MPARSFFLTFLLALTFQISKAQETPKTLLWRITGNNFSKPCYLYGTMHTKDKRAYYLGDSVYSSIKSCDGFAMEIDPAEAIDSAWEIRENEKLDIAYRQAIENDLVEKGPDYYKERQKEFDSVFIKMRKRFQDFSLGDVIRLEKAYRRRMKNDMRTRLDLYLFDLAKTQGKVVGAVEDLVDQSSIKLDKENQFDEDAFLAKQKKKYADLQEWMIETYAAAELDKFDAFSKSKPQHYQTIMLYNRNNKMARRIDSLGNIRSSFCAVGCAHLPGDSGVINLLRKRGFTVEPVFSSRRIEPGDISIETKPLELVSISDADSNYVVQMPGKPTWITTVTNKLFLKTYKELSNEILLMCGVYEDGKTYRTVDKVVDEIKTYFSSHEVKLYNTKPISRQETDGYEINFRNGEGYIRMNIFCSNGRTFMFAAGSKNKDSMNSVRCENFLATYKMILNRPVRETSMISFVSAEKAFSIEVPAELRQESVEGQTITKEDITLFSTIDPRRKINYLVLVKEPYKGYFPGSDSSSFTQTIKEIKKGAVQKYLEETNTLLDGYPAVKVKIGIDAAGKNQVIYSVMAIRHNRFYCVTIRGLALPENEPLFEKYFNSFHFIPYQQASFEKKIAGNNLFSVTAPSPIQFVAQDTGNDGKKETRIKIKNSYYFAFDSNTAMNYGVTALHLGKYYWVNGEKAFIEEQANVFYNDSLAVNNIYKEDSLVYKKDVCNGEIISKELLLKNITGNFYTRLRLMHYADSVFIIHMKGDKELLTDGNADTFFSSFRFINENYSSGIFIPKTKLLLQDLQSPDSAVWSAPVSALKEGFHFPQQELDMLTGALLYNYPAVEKGADIPALLAATIAPYANEYVLDFIKTNYPLLKNKREDVRMEMINILSSTKTKEAYTLLKGFLLNDEPSYANYDVVLSNFSKAPSLAAGLFPEIAVKIKDEYEAADFLELANMLIDSNKLQYDVIRGYEENIITLVKKMLRQYEDNSYRDLYLPHTEAVLNLLIKMDQKKGNDLVKDFIDLDNYPLTRTIILCQIKNGREVPESVFNEFCDDPNRMVGLYYDLLQMGKQSFFKGKHATQQSFAEAFAGIYTNTQVPARIAKDYDMVAVKDEMVNDVLSRFYIFKVKCHFVYENISYTCIIGPFSPDQSNFSIPEGNEKFILYRIKYKPEDINSLFDDFIRKIKKMK